jgi:3-dehydroquinate synthase
VKTRTLSPAIDMRTIASRSHDYTVEEFATVAGAVDAAGAGGRPHFLVDRAVHEAFAAELADRLPADRLLLVEATEDAKSYAALEPVFLELLQRGLNRSGSLVVIGGGVLQDLGCFVASVLARGIRWQLLPTTLLAQADSCIGSKSSINIGRYKNQIGTFYPPHRVLLVPEFLRTLPFDEIRSGLGEVIKLQLLAGERGFGELMADLAGLAAAAADDRQRTLARWVDRSMDVKQPVIEADEFDRGPRLLLNYGHTFGHAFESVTEFAIPHGIAVVLGMLTATHLSAALGMVPARHAEELSRMLAAWHDPHAAALRPVAMDDLLQALARDKKNSAAGLTCILTRGIGRMERVTLTADQIRAHVAPTLARLIETGFTA